MSRSTGSDHAVQLDGVGRLDPRAAGLEQSSPVVEVAVDGQSLDPRPLGDRADGHRRWADRGAQLDRCVDDAASGAIGRATGAGRWIPILPHHMNSSVTYRGRRVNTHVYIEDASTAVLARRRDP
jgi:hypothetical protein